MDKFKNSEIKPFVFSDLQGTHVVTQPKTEKFEFKTLDGEVFKSEKPASEVIRVEREFEQAKSFKIDQIVREHRGLAEQENDDFELRVAQEVNKRVEEIYQKAFEQGVAAGREEGINQVLAQKSTQLNEVVQVVSELTQDFKNQLENATLNHKTEILKFVNQFSKWVLAKEINTKDYLSHLLEKLLHELNVRRNIIIRVNESSYQFMPDIIANLEAKLGALSNVRVEISQEMQHPGIIVESENGIVDASLENIFTKFDRFFEQVGKGE